MKPAKTPPRIARATTGARAARVERRGGSRRRCRPSLPAVAILCLFALAAAGQQPSTTAGQGSAGKAPAKAGSATTATGSRQSAAQPSSAAGAAGTAGTARTPGAAGTATGASGAGGPKQPAGAPTAPGAPAFGAPKPDMGNIDQILEGDEEVLAGGNSFTYDPGNRRDPFKSLLIAPDRPEFRGPRPEGVPGLLIDEIDLKGIFRTARGFVAQVNASNQKKSYLLKEGDQLYDGDVMSIGKNEVVFKQIVQDPTALKPFREIVKSLNPGG